MKNWLFLLLALPLLFSGCRKDIDEITTTETSYQLPVVVVTSTLTGQVIGPNRQGIAGVTIQVGNLSTVTDDRGYYQLSNVRVNARGTYVTAEKAGYFPGSDRFYPINGSAYFSTIQLLPKTAVGLFDANTGGTITMQGAAVEFPANAIADGQGNPYTGQVTVMARWLDPTAPDLDEFMPGNLFGVNTDGRPVVMASFGMMAVELYGASGQLLNMAQGQQATLRMQVPNELRSAAPAQIPLWFFDETAGLWIEEGKATLQGDSYVGKVSHFTFWNLDVPSNTPLVFISGCVTLADGTPAGNVFMTVANADDNLVYVGAHTDPDGQFAGYIPSNVPLVFHVTNNCSVVQSFTVPPLTANTDLGCFVLDTANTVTISGQVVDCDGEGIAHALVSIQRSDNNYTYHVAADATGQFSTVISTCNSLSSVSVAAYDVANLVGSASQTHNISGVTLALGQVAACDNPLDEYLVSAVDGVTFTFLQPNVAPDSLQAGYVIYGYFTTSDPSVYRSVEFRVPSIDVGAYTGSSLSFYQSIRLDSNIIHLNCSAACNTITLNITANGGPGGYLIGTYTGISEGGTPQSPSQELPVSGHFRIRIPL
jgi:hypothetical protein